jgi:cytochrome d ubiquinol oxidase subunit II
LVAAALAGAVGTFYFPRRGQELAAFLSSCTFLLSILAATMAGQYPHLLRSTLDPALSVTVSNAAAGAYGLRIGAIWWTIGMLLTASYFFYLFRSFRGKVTAGPEGGSY